MAKHRGRPLSAIMNRELVQDYGGPEQPVRRGRKAKPIKPPGQVWVVMDEWGITGVYTALKDARGSVEGFEEPYAVVKYDQVSTIVKHDQVTP